MLTFELPVRLRAWFYAENSPTHPSNWRAVFSISADESDVTLLKVELHHRPQPATHLAVDAFGYWPCWTTLIGLLDALGKEVKMDEDFCGARGRR